MKRIRLTEQELINVIGQIINEEFNTTLPIQYKPVLSQQYTSQQPQQPPTNQQPMRSQQGQTPQYNKRVAPKYDKTEVCKICYNAFRKAGATDGAAKGILANVASESRFNPNSIGWDGNGKTFGIGGGLFGFYYGGWLPSLAKYCGWTKEDLDSFNAQIINSGLPEPKNAYSKKNKEHIMSVFGDFPFTFEQQLSFVIGQKKYFNKVKNITDPQKAAWVWEDIFENPLHMSDRWKKNGQTVLRLLGQRR